MSVVAPPLQPVSKAGPFSDQKLARVRIVSGMILFAYLVSHLVNHTFGLISLEAMEEAGRGFKSFWRSWPASIILYGALTGHVMCSLWRVVRRRSLKMPAREWVQLVFGLAIPPLMIGHVMGTRYGASFYGINDSYTYVVLAIFVQNPTVGLMINIGLVAAWLHGCIGMHMWMKIKPWYSLRIQFVALIFATLLPTLALAGYLAAGRFITPLASTGEFLESYYENLNLPDDAQLAAWARDVEWVEWIFWGVLGGLLIARIIQYFARKKNRMVTINYMDGPTVQQSIGSTLLDMSKLGGVPHASVCGGRGRCSTCRVQIISSASPIDPPTDAERKVLDRVRAADDVRLACQLRPTADLQVIRLLPSDISMAQAASVEPWSTGSEKVIAVMFADLRDFTRTAEARLPFDVVYLINQFSQSMGQVVESHGGRIDKFLGDGFMALFGVEGTPQAGARAAIAASGAMIAEMEALNQKLAADLDEPLRMGIGVHTGSVILGKMGYGTSRGLTAIGDTVNTASRLEAATKAEKCLLCVSVDTIELAEMTAPKSTRRSIAVRGKKHKLDICALHDTSTLEDIKNDSGV